MADPSDWAGADAFGVGDDHDVVQGSPSVGLDADPSAFLEDDGFVNAFTEEIENITASDWDVDADVLWGDDGSLGTGPDPTGFDFPA
ncbi:hypothetical protein ACFT30_14415 [Microbacterium ureisolvens]|uniref:hypothetical protein n=1 Tax=Microbacterium ureisolvens TaxID=2781186 RepID=UPI00362C13F9